MKKLKRMVFNVTNYHAGWLEFFTFVVIVALAFDPIAVVAMKTLFKVHPSHGALNAAFLSGVVSLVVCATITSLIDRLLTARIAGYTMRKQWFRR